MKLSLETVVTGSSILFGVLASLLTAWRPNWAFAAVAVLVGGGTLFVASGLLFRYFLRSTRDQSKGWTLAYLLGVLNGRSHTSAQRVAAFLMMALSSTAAASTGFLAGLLFGSVFLSRQ